MTELEGKDIKMGIVSIAHPYIQEDRGKHEPGKERHGRYKKDPTPTLRDEKILYLRWKNTGRYKHQIRQCRRK